MSKTQASPRAEKGERDTYAANRREAKSPRALASAPSSISECPCFGKRRCSSFSLLLSLSLGTAPVHVPGPCDNRGMDPAERVSLLLGDPPRGPELGEIISPQIPRAQSLKAELRVSHGQRRGGEGVGGK